MFSVRFARPASGCLALVLAVCSGRSRLVAQQWEGRDRLESERCRPESGDARAWLRRADSSLGRHRLGDRVLSFEAVDSDEQFFQSDRMYPPFVSAKAANRYWYDGTTGVERFGPSAPAGAPRSRDVVRTEHATFVSRDTSLAPAAGLHRFQEASRGLNPLAVLADWSGAESVRVVARCSFRDYPRVVLERQGGDRLYLSSETGTPVKLERIEPHYLWGQVRAEYVYATYWQTGPVIYPLVAVRYLDGVEHLRRDVSLPQTQGAQAGVAVARDSVPRLALPNVVPDHRSAPDVMLSPVAVDTVRVSPTTMLLRTRMYTHAVTLARDTLFLFDATTAEWRSRADSALIAGIFPGRHPVVLVVTDLAWPHIAGVRFWAARGARIVTHPLSKPFVDRVLARRWSLTPDLLEKTRSTAHPIVVAAASQELAGGAIRLRPIDGVASEGALMALIAADGFMWASDYIQTVDGPSLYAREVAAAVRRAGFAPRKAAAQHLGLTEWSRVEAAATER